LKRLTAERFKAAVYSAISVPLNIGTAADR
jgi:hypothetical protein